ncbi:hypothetical protein Sango_3073800 [Sesamum angolense]|uniref:Uncharacterized protein n=1 Tax=Sesamum angolense TaxID=2727404 RepID=A0AAE1W0I2_9LAMI|nr:hypothetical protein Sango_3073800 [Sesamum angolense]
MKQPSKPPLKGFVPSTQEEEERHEALAKDEKGFNPKAFKLLIKAEYNPKEFSLGKLLPEATGNKLHRLNATQIMLKEKGHAIQDFRVGLGFTPPKTVRITIKRVNNNYVSEGFSSTEDHKKEENLRESIFNRLGTHRKELHGIANRQSVFDRFMVEYYNWTSHGEDIVQDYYEAPSVPQVSEEPTSAGHFEGVLDDGTRSCPMDAYDQISERIYNRISQWANKLLSFDHTLPGDYYSTKKLVKDLGLPVKKIHACKNGCMLYWKVNVDLEYCKLCWNGRYRLALGRDLHWKKSSYAVLRYPPLTPRLQRLYSSRAIAEHRRGMPHIKQQRGRCVIHPMPRRGSILIGCILILQKSRVMFGWVVAQMVLYRTVSTVVLIHVGRLSLHRTIFPLLWHVGMRMYDHATDRAFMMRAALMWTVNDLLVYGMASGWSTAGVMGCPICMDDTKEFHLQHGRNVRYFGCHRQFLPAHHPYRRNKKSFMKNRVENKVARPRLTRDQILAQVVNISHVVEMLSLLPDVYGSDHKWTKKSIFSDLLYWSTLLI